jgi:hypothetical protein
VLQHAACTSYRPYRDHLERLRVPRRPERCPQIIDMIDQQTPPAFQQVHGEEERTARHMFAAITRHPPACQHHEARNIRKPRAQRRHSPQRMPHSPKVRQGAPYKDSASLGRAPARRLHELQALLGIGAKRKASAPAINTRLERRLRLIKRMPAKPKQQLLGLIDTFIAANNK